jgi:hypothetical protein
MLYENLIDLEKILMTDEYYARTTTETKNLYRKRLIEKAKKNRQDPANYLKDLLKSTQDISSLLFNEKETSAKFFIYIIAVFFMTTTVSYLLAKIFIPYILVGFICLLIPVSEMVINILNNKDLEIIKNTKLGEMGLFNENIVPLDFPIQEGTNIFIYSLDPIDKKVNKVFLNESYDERLFQIEAKIILDKNEKDINETLSDIRAIKGVTIVHIEDVDELWSKETQHSLKIKIKIDPAPFDNMNKSVFMMILNEIKKMPGVLKAAYITKPKTI